MGGEGYGRQEKPEDAGDPKRGDFPYSIPLPTYTAEHTHTHTHTQPLPAEATRPVGAGVELFLCCRWSPQVPTWFQGTQFTTKAPGGARKKVAHLAWT